MIKKISLEEYVTSQSFYSRREFLNLMKDKKVFVNEELVLDLKLPVTPNVDSIKVDGLYVDHNYEYMYFKFYKPKGILSTMKDPSGRACIGDYIKKFGKPVMPVGRLDRHSNGLMVMTNDGDFSNLLMHPSYKIEKEYYVKLDRYLEKKDITRLEKGLMLDDGPVCFSNVSLFKSRNELMVTISEGRNRIVRRAFDHLGYQVKSLKRECVGTFSLSDMKSGDIKSISKKELSEFKKYAAETKLD
jgi:23S rRNA pseudouridine2605 synthase